MISTVPCIDLCASCKDVMINVLQAKSYITEITPAVLKTTRNSKAMLFDSLIAS